MAVLPARVLFGAAYYHEYQPYERLKTDLDLMAEARFTVIRVGESVWSTWEPENGRFDLDWLAAGPRRRPRARHLASSSARPTYAVPPWLARQYPEIAGERRTGQRIGWGARQEVDFTHPALPVPRRAGHPRRSSPGTPTTRRSSASRSTTSPACELLPQPRRLPAIRRPPAAAATATSRPSTASGAWSTGRTGCPPGPTCGRPDGNVQPQYDAGLAALPGPADHRVHRLAGRHRPRVRPRRTSSSPPASPTTGPAVDDDELTGRLDVTAGNPYYDMQDGLALPDRDRDDADRLDDQRARGRCTRAPTGCTRRARSRSWSPRPTPRPSASPGTTGPPTTGSGGRPPGRWSSRGARDDRVLALAHPALRRRDLLGRSPSAQRPARAHVRASSPGSARSSTRAGDLVAGLTPDADVTMVYSMPSKWLMQKYPPLADRRTADRTPRRTTASSTRSTAAPSTPACRSASSTPASCTARAATPGRRRSRPPTAPGPRRRRRCTSPTTPRSTGSPPTPQAGGHLVLGPRTGYADHEARARTRGRHPARLVEAAGVWYDEFSNLARDVPVRAAPDGPLRPAGRRGGDPLGRRPAPSTDAEVLAELRPPALRPLAGGHHPPPRRGPGHLRRHGARPRPRPGAGRMARAGRRPADGATSRPRVTATTGTAPDGRRVHVVHNWSWEPVAVEAPVDR